MREGFVMSAFTAWQLGAGKKGTTFGAYLRKMGLTPNPESGSPADTARLAQMGIVPAEAPE